VITNAASAKWICVATWNLAHYGAEEIELEKQAGALLKQVRSWKTGYSPYGDWKGSAGKALDELIAWGKAQPRTAATRAEIVRRYLGVVAGGAEVFRMLQQNQAAVAGLASAKERGELFRERIDALIDLLTGPSATLRDQVRAASALMSVSFGCMRYQNQVSSQEELEQALLDVAMELVGVAPADARA